MTLLSVTSCSHIMPELSSGSTVYVSDGVTLWSLMTPEDLQKPVGEFLGRDILTSETATGILINNEKIAN
jgi:hypothetical protein